MKMQLSAGIVAGSMAVATAAQARPRSKPARSRSTKVHNSAFIPFRHGAAHAAR